jgi:TRAP-type C4-dicarboxylate transport system substrate-binding protein
MRTVIIAAAALALAATGAEAATKLKLSNYLPPQHGINTDFIASWTAAVTECTNGEVTFDVFPGGTPLGNVAKQQEQVLAGVVDLAVGLNGIPRGRFPRTSITDMPFLVKDAGAASQMLWTLYPDYLAPEYEGLKVLALFAHNGGLIHTRDKEVKTMADLRGLRIRTPSPAISDMLTALGATPQGLPPGEVYEALQKGTLDGTVFPWDPVASFGLNEVLTYHLDAGAYTVPFFFVMNERKYDALPEAVRACIDQSSGEGLVAKFGDWWDKWDAIGREQAIAAGHVINTLSDAERERWREALAPMIRAYLDALEGEGVDDPDAIYKAMQDAVARFEE